MRTINQQISDIAKGQKTVMDILSEGVGEYGIRYFSPYAAGCSDEEARAYVELRTAWVTMQEAQK